MIHESHCTKEGSICINNAVITMLFFYSKATVFLKQKSKERLKSKMAYFESNSGFIKLSKQHESDSLEHGNSGNSTIRLDTADEVEVTHI